MEWGFFKWAWAFKKSATKRNVEEAIQPILSINLLSRDLFEDLKNQQTIGDFHYERKGLYMFYQHEKYAEEEFKTARRAEALGLEVKHYNSTEINGIEPKSRVEATGAFWYGSDAHTSPKQFMQLLKDYLKEAGVNFYTNTAVEDFCVKGKTITELVTKEGNIKAKDIVLAAGSWSAKLLKKLKIELHLQAGKGYAIDDSKVKPLPTLHYF